MFGVKVKAFRERLGISQEKLGKSVGLNQSTVYRIETEAYDPKLSTLRALAKGLGVSVAELITDEEKEVI